MRILNAEELEGKTVTKATFDPNNGVALVTEDGDTYYVKAFPIENGACVTEVSSPSLDFALKAGLITEEKYAKEKALDKAIFEEQQHAVYVGLRNQFCPSDKYAMQPGPRWEHVISFIPPLPVGVRLRLTWIPSDSSGVHRATGVLRSALDGVLLCDTMLGKKVVPSHLLSRYLISRWQVIREKS